MPHKRLAGRNFHLSGNFPELEAFKTVDGLGVAIEQPDVFDNVPIISTEGLVAGFQRGVEVYGGAGNYLLKIQDCGEYYIVHDGETLGKWNQPNELSQLDRDVLLGPVVVLALALRDVWSLHASAVQHDRKGFVFMGETGRGKSTLASYLSSDQGWHLVADDILPVSNQSHTLMAYPHFPQLKLPPDAQPAMSLPEHLPLDMVFELTPAGPDALPELRQLSDKHAVQVLISHTAGTRLFDEKLLGKHLAFCAQAVEYVSVYQLTYPHSRAALPRVRELLESLC